tara:strand:- start:261 stop:506 length:246 start_codon:yes stop_codon:yes gene_type:complete
MNIAVDISLYPLDNNFIPPIKDFIKRLQENKSIVVVTNPMSTQVRGEYETVMSIIQKEIKKTFLESSKAVFAIKVLNNPMK